MEQKVAQFGELIHGMPYEQYAFEIKRHNALRSGYLKHLKKSPAHLKASIDNPQEETEALAFGKKVHKIFEDPEKFRDYCVYEPVFTGKTKDGKESTRSGEAREKKEAWYANIKPEQIVLTVDEIPVIDGIMKSVKNHKLVRNLLKEGLSEQSLFVKDSDTGLILSCRADFISTRGHVIDIKTTRDASPGFFLNQIFSDRSNSPYYILNAAHYAHCMREAKVGSGESFTFVAIEKKEPYGIMVYPMDIGCLAPGEQWRSVLTKRYAECVEKNIWPCYEERAFPATPPQWSSVPHTEEDDDYN